MLYCIRSMIRFVSGVWLAAVLGMVLTVAAAFAAPPAPPVTPMAQPPASAPAPKAVFSETTYTFEAVMEGTTIRHDFIIENQGAGPLLIEKVQPD